jgi:inner membrane protein
MRASSGSSVTCSASLIFGRSLPPMNPINHLLVSWPLAAVPSRLRLTEQRCIVGAGLAPDLDGLGIFPEVATRNSADPVLWWSEYHHLLAHNLPFGLLVAGAVAVITRRAKTVALAFLAFHLHLACDLIGSRGPDGYQWPIAFLFPFSRSPEWAVPWQWALNAWPNVVLTVVLLAFALWYAARSSQSPLGLISARADGALVTALRNRFHQADRPAQ